MKTNTTYQCEVCGRNYGDAESATECEAKANQVVPPIGLLSMGEPGDFYDHRLAFAVAGTAVDGHCLRVGKWACRDNGYGDNLGKDLCGSSGGGYEGPTEFNPAWLTRPPMMRLLEWMKQNGHVPLVSIGGEIVRLDEVKIPTSAAS